MAAAVHPPEERPGKGSLGSVVNDPLDRQVMEGGKENEGGTKTEVAVVLKDSASVVVGGVCELINKINAYTVCMG